MIWWDKYEWKIIYSESDEFHTWIRVIRSIYVVVEVVSLKKQFTQKKIWTQQKKVAQLLQV